MFAKEAEWTPWQFYKNFRDEESLKKALLHLVSRIDVIQGRRLAARVYSVENGWLTVDQVNELVVFDLTKLLNQN